MNYFNYVPEGVSHLGKVWGLFDSMTLEEINRYDYEYSLEVVKSALQGNIVISDEEKFPLKQYTFGCSKNEKIARRQNYKKELFIVDSFSDDEERINFGDISSNVLKDIDVMLDVMIDTEAFEQSIQNLMGVRNKYLVTEGIDIVELVKGALTGVASSIKRLSRLTKRDFMLKCLLEGLLGTGHGEELMGRLTAMGV